VSGTELLGLAEYAAELAAQWGGREPAEALRAAIARARDQRVHLLVVGQFKRGKTTLINALTGHDLLPRAVTPLTSVITLVRAGAPSAQVRFESGQEREIPVSELADYVTERGNPRNARAVRLVEVTLPSPLLDGGLVLIDTPGTGSIFHHNTAVARGFLPHADAALFVVSADPVLSAEERADLALVAQSAAVVICVLNKIDQLEPEDREVATAFTREQLAAAGRGDVPVVAVSSRDALRARTGADGPLLASSGIPELEAMIEREVTGRTRALTSAGVRERALGALEAVEARLALERRAVALDERQAAERLERFAGIRAAIERTLEQQMVGIRARAQLVVREKVEPRLAELKDTGAAALEAELDARARDGLSLADDELEPWLSERLSALVGGWVGEIERIVANSVEPVLAEAAAGANELRERALREATALFDLALPPRRALASPSAPSTEGLLRLDHQASGGLELAVGALRRRAPGRVGRRAQLRAARARAVDLVDRHAGRLRSATASALDAALGQTGRAQAAALEATLALVDRALRGADGARRLRTEGRAEWDRRLAQAQRQVADLRARIEQASSDQDGPLGR